MHWGIDPTLIGPYSLPWHGLLTVLDVASVLFVLFYWRKHGKLHSEQWMWPALALTAHVFYSVRLAEQTPTFDLEIRYYGVCFAIGLLGAAKAFPTYFERWGFPKKDAEELTLWTPIGMLLGAHFVHLVFYEWDALIHNPIRIFQLGSGLASHGGGLGAVIAMAWFCKRRGINPMRYVDPSMCAATWVIPWVRVGNFFNSEIVGRVWDGPWAVAFLRHGEVVDGRYVPDCPGFPARMCAEPLTRHPSQAYEAILAFIMLGLAIYLQRRWRNRLRPGAIFFILLAYYFTTRFFIEYVKDYQALSESFPFTMGQMLSLPIILISLWMLGFSKTSNIRSVIAGPEVIDNPPPFEAPREDDDADASGAETSSRDSEEKTAATKSSGTDGSSKASTKKKRSGGKKKKKRG